MAYSKLENRKRAIKKLIARARIMKDTGYTRASEDIKRRLDRTKEKLHGKI